MFFKEFCRTAELSSNLDPYAEQPVSVSNAADFILPYENIFGEIAGSIIGAVQPFSIAMPGVKIAENKSYLDNLFCCLYAWSIHVGGDIYSLLVGEIQLVEAVHPVCVTIRPRWYAHHTLEASH